MLQYRGNIMEPTYTAPLSGYVRSKVTHLLRRHGKGNAGVNKITGAATTRERCKELGHPELFARVPSLERQ